MYNCYPTMPLLPEGKDKLVKIIRQHKYTKNPRRNA